MFESLPPAPPDAILGLNEAFKQDPHPQRINLTIGQYKDGNGDTPILDCVREAERRLLASRETMGYLGIDGLPEFGEAVRGLLFAPASEIPATRRAVTVQSVGGTGALRLAGEFIQRRHPDARVWCSQPTWPNHPSIFAAAGLQVESYSYYDPTKNRLAFGAWLADLKRIPAGDFVCLHGCCHNPTGIDPTREQWAQIAEAVHEGGLFPIVDFAYLGFANGLEEDAVGLREVSQSAREMFICSSFSKNFSLYGERVGALTIVAANAEQAELALGHVKTCVRANYSNPPRHGAGIVAAVLGSDELKSQWESELGEMRNRINSMRRLFVDAMQARNASRDFSFIADQRGMFSLTGLTPGQADRLREEFSVYLVKNGRINVAGITEKNIDRLCDAICEVL